MQSRKCDVSVMRPSSAQFTDHVIGGGGFLQIELERSQEMQYDFYILIYRRERNWFIPREFKGCVAQRKTDSDVCEGCEKSRGLHQGPHSSEPFPTQIGHTPSVQEMSKEQWN